MNTTSASRSQARQSLHHQFLNALPRVVRHARVVFRFIRCWHTLQDKIQEVRALCWKWVKKLHQAGKPWWDYVSRLADFACRAVKSGRKVCGMVSAKDVLNEITQARRSFYVGKLPDCSTLNENPLAEALIDNTQSEIPAQVCFRIDFPAWMRTRTRRDRRMIPDMAAGERTSHLARKYRLSPARVSQLRRQYCEDWTVFCGD